MTRSDNEAEKSAAYRVGWLLGALAVGAFLWVLLFVVGMLAWNAAVSITGGPHL